MTLSWIIEFTITVAVKLVRFRVSSAAFPSYSGSVRQIRLATCTVQSSWSRSFTSTSFELGLRDRLPCVSGARPALQPPTPPPPARPPRSCPPPCRSAVFRKFPAWPCSERCCDVVLRARVRGTRRTGEGAQIARCQRPIPQKVAVSLFKCLRKQQTLSRLRF